MPKLMTDEALARKIYNQIWRSRQPGKPSWEQMDDVFRRGFTRGVVRIADIMEKHNADDPNFRDGNLSEE